MKTQFVVKYTLFGLFPSTLHMGKDAHNAKSFAGTVFANQRFATRVRVIAPEGDTIMELKKNLTGKCVYRKVA